MLLTVLLSTAPRSSSARNLNTGVPIHGQGRGSYVNDSVALVRYLVHAISFVHFGILLCSRQFVNATGILPSLTDQFDTTHL